MVKNYHSELKVSHDASPTRQLRRQADELLQRLIEGRERSQQRLAESGQRDAMQFITGRTALDDAITTTRSMIREMDDLLDQMNDDLTAVEGADENDVPAGKHVELSVLQ